MLTVAAEGCPGAAAGAADAGRLSLIDETGRECPADSDRGAPGRAARLYPGGDGPGQRVVTLLRKQACGCERAMADLADDLLLAGVVLHHVLSSCVGLGRGLALDSGVAVALVGVAP